MNTRTIALVVVMTVLGALPLGAAPARLTQQGRLLDDAGAPVVGSHGVVFTLHDASTDGTELWREERVVSFDAGTYSVVLGTQVSLDEQLFAAGSVWLQLEVDGELLSPRHEVMSVPYALRAVVAERVEGGAVDASQLSIGGALVVDAAGNWLGVPPDWSTITGVPADLADGDQNTDALQALGLSCLDGQVPHYVAATDGWVCDVDQDTVTTTLPWSAISDVPADIADGDLDTDTLASLSCSDGAVPTWNAASAEWLCVNLDAFADSDADGVVDSVDCAPNDSGVSHFATEVCDGVDNNCDGRVDDDDPTTASTTWYGDSDGDGAAGSLITIQACGQPAGFLPTATDCDDADALNFPGNDEVCDGQDNDCDPSNDLVGLGQSTACAALSCLAIQNDVPGALDGVYYIDPDSSGVRQAYCDMSTDGGGWTLAMRRAGAQFQEEWMYNTWGAGSLPDQSTTADTSWKVPDTATRIRFAFTDDGSDTATDYIITTAPGDPASNTGMWFTEPGIGDFPVTLIANEVSGLSSVDIRWNFRTDSGPGVYDYFCYGVSSGQSYSSHCDHTNALFGAIKDNCPATNHAEVYIGNKKNIAGSGAGGSYCDTEDPNATWWVWWRDD